jgi:hypothetical protein
MLHYYIIWCNLSKGKGMSFNKALDAGAGWVLRPSRLHTRMEAVPLHLREANQFVAQHHRHNLPCVGCMFALGAAVDGNVVGVAICGRPICRKLDDGKTLEGVSASTRRSLETRLDDKCKHLEVTH